MSQPTLIIEICDGKLDTIYSNTDLDFLVITRNTTAENTVTCERFTPTLAIPDLSKLYPNEPQIVAALEKDSDPPAFF
jgi:hypothetical protein